MFFNLFYYYSCIFLQNTDNISRYQNSRVPGLVLYKNSGFITFFLNEGQGDLPAKCLLANEILMQNGGVTTLTFHCTGHMGKWLWS